MKEKIFFTHNKQNIYFQASEWYKYLPRIIIYYFVLRKATLVSCKESLKIRKIRLLWVSLTHELYVYEHPPAFISSISHVSWLFNQRGCSYEQQNKQGITKNLREIVLRRFFNIRYILQIK